MPSENGWEPARVNAAQCNWVTVPGTNVTLQILKGQPTAVLRAAAADFNAYIEPLRDADSACYTPTNSVPTSNHLNASACDWNWDSHPFHAKGTFNQAQMKTIREMQRFYTQDGLLLLFWAGDWASPIDEMHWQMGYSTYGDPRVQKFIDTKIRPDGFSTFRRGGVVDVPSKATGFTAEVLSEAMGGTVPLSRYAELLPAVKEALRLCDCTTVNRIAMWMAQVGHESAGLKYMEEIADGSAYEGRRDLGNTQPGDGRKFKGHGPIQITGRYNHTKVSEWAYSKGLASPTFFVDNPRELASDRYGFLGVIWYWTIARPMNSYADAGDLDGATRAVNGGLNGWADRRDRWNRCRALHYDITFEPTEEGFLMALSEAEQREMLDLLRQQAGVRRESSSPLRHLNSTYRNTIAGYSLSADGNVHVLLSYLLAQLGHPPTLSLLNDLANADLSKYPDRADGKNIAKAILTKIQMPSAPTTVVRQAEPEVLPYIPPPTPTYVPPTPAPQRQVAAPVRMPAEAPETGLLAEITSLTAQLRGVSETVSKIVQGSDDEE